MRNNEGMTLTEFLEARIAEDEARASSGWARLGDLRWETTNEGQDFLTPSAVLAECAAKRRMVGYYRMLIEQSEQAEVFGYHATGLKVALRFLAAVYKDHPDYQQEWSA